MLWSWVLSLLGVYTFWLAGRKVWWTWYVGLFNQVLWFCYALWSMQWGFLVSCIFYTAIYWVNAKRWTTEHRNRND